jgi:septum formation protein
MRTVVVTSHITFVALNSHLIEWYVATGEPWGKAGAYAVQGAGGVLVKDVQGSLSNVVGLPLREVADMLHLKGARAKYRP